MVKRFKIKETESDFDENMDNIELVKTIRTARRKKRAKKDIGVTDTDFDYSMALIKEPNQIKDRMVKVQNEYFSNEETEDVGEYLRSLHAIDSKI